MDIIQDAINRYIEGGRAVFSDVSWFFSDPGRIVDKIDTIDWRINTSLLLLSSAIIAFTTMIFLANFTSYGQSTKKVVKEVLPIPKPGSPPIPPPTEIISLRIYPIKSCRGIEITSTRLRKSGLTLDRNWMFIDASTRKFQTIRENSKMTLINTAIVEDSERTEQHLEITIQDTSTHVLVPAFPSTTWLEKNCSLKTVEIWEEETDAWEYAPEINAPFSTFFGKPVALVYKGHTHQQRMVNVNGRADLYGSATPHHFADVMSLLIASQSSIDDLNRRLKAQNNTTVPFDLAVERFRPNIIIRGRKNHPWEEDTYKRVRISTTLHKEEAIYKIDLDAVARCARCQVPNVNPETAEKHPKEPWTELMKFRRVDTGSVAKYKPCVGMLAIPRQEGKIAVGATLEVLETTANHLYNERKFADL